MKISVGICTHNGEKYIREQLESIVNQTIQPDEIVVSDDNSTDTTIEIANEILKNSGIDYKILPFKEHIGILKNFQTCLDTCTGDIIFSCDQDDIWMKDKIESFLPKFQEGCNFVYSNAIVVDSERNVLENDFWALYNIDFENTPIQILQKRLLSEGMIAGCNMAFRRELLQKVNPIPYHFLHDGWLAICAPLFGKMGFINKPLIEYRRHGKNVSSFSADVKLSDEKQQPEKKKIIGDTYRKTFPYLWFGDQHCYVCSKIFYERMNEYMTDDYKRLVEKFILFRQDLLKVLPSHRVKSAVILFKHFLNGNYRTFRGSIKSFVGDLVYIFFNENKEFQHDENAW